MFLTFKPSEPHIWIVWFGLFGFESVLVITISNYTPGIELDDTHLTTRMGLLTLIIIGEHVISVTRIVNKMVAGGGWTLASLVHVMGVVTTVVCPLRLHFDGVH
jgi:low temperature requirement protein LtrA